MFRKEHQYAECQKRRLKVVLKQSCYLTAWKMLHKRQLRFIIADSGHCSTLVKVEKVEFVEKHILIMSEVAFLQTSGRFLKLVIQMKQKKKC